MEHTTASRGSAARKNGAPLNRPPKPFRPASIIVGCTPRFFSTKEHRVPAIPPPAMATRGAAIVMTQPSRLQLFWFVGGRKQERSKMKNSRKFAKHLEKYCGRYLQLSEAKAPSNHKQRAIESKTPSKAKSQCAIKETLRRREFLLLAIRLLFCCRFYTDLVLSRKREK
jgi:hypothetical protein